MSREERFLSTKRAEFERKSIYSSLSPSFSHLLNSLLNALTNPPLFSREKRRRDEAMIIRRKIFSLLIRVFTIRLPEILTKPIRGLNLKRRTAPKKRPPIRGRITSCFHKRKKILIMNGKSAMKPVLSKRYLMMKEIFNSLTD